MPRPQLDEETVDRVTAAVDERTKVPATHLTTDERIAFVLDVLDQLERQNARLADRVDALEDELEAARAEATDDSPPSVDEIASADLPNGLDPTGRR